MVPGAANYIVATWNSWVKIKKLAFQRSQWTYCFFLKILLWRVIAILVFTYIVFKNIPETNNIYLKSMNLLWCDNDLWSFFGFLPIKMMFLGFFGLLMVSLISSCVLIMYNEHVSWLWSGSHFHWSQNTLQNHLIIFGCNSIEGITIRLICVSTSGLEGY